MKTLNKQNIQKTALIDSSDIRLDDFLRIYKRYTTKL